jgi:hypothetical protein
MNSFHVSIKTPCTESWNTMTPQPHGKFCDKCAKTVVDFTGMAKDEIKNYFIDHKENKICGRIYNSQMDSTVVVRLNFLPTDTSSNPYHIFYLSFFLIFGTTLFSCNNHQDERIDKIDVAGINIETETTSDISPAIETNKERIITTTQRASKRKVEIPTSEKIDTVNLPSVNIVDSAGRLISISELGAMGYYSVEDINILDEDTSTIIQRIEAPVKETESHFDIFPNPADDYVNVKIVLSGQMNVKVDLFDMNGRLIRTIVPITPIENEIDQQIEIGDLPPATYFMRLIKGEQVETKRLVVI